MRPIQIDEGFRIRFPGQDASFDAGVEIGVVATFMTMKMPEFVRAISADNLDQARVVARKLGYHLAELDHGSDDTVSVTFRIRTLAPKLRLVARAG